MAIKYPDVTNAQVHEAVDRSAAAFSIYQKTTPKERSLFLQEMAKRLEKNAAGLIAVAHSETHLEKARLQVELDRTVFQLVSYAMVCEEGFPFDIRIDTAQPNQTPSKPSLHKMSIPLGPVTVFGASNFPFAYSTAGGDTACALAAGCTVLVKAHPAHAETSAMVAMIISEAAKACGLPEDVFIHLHHAGFEAGKTLLLHPKIAAVAFTGSLEGGRALFDLANSRPVPIPVFAEMGSVNPVFFLPRKLEADGDVLAPLLAVSITQSAGQFCTNPGLLIAIKSKALHEFKKSLGALIAAVSPAQMLHPGIAKAYQHKRSAALEAIGVKIIGTLACPVGREESIPTLAEVSAFQFLKNPLLQQEVFGPFSLLVTCEDWTEMRAVAESLEGQLTTTLHAAEDETPMASQLLEILERKCGRIIFNGVPTGVQVSLAMHHGGPYPATTDSRFTAVGADGIKRFLRPICFQAFPEMLLPPALQTSNPLGLWRTVDGQLTR